MNSGTFPLGRWPVKAVVFDLDETLVASGHLESFRLTRNHRGLEAALATLSTPPHLHDQLRRLGRVVPLGIVTTSPRWYAERLLAYLYPDIQWQAVVTYGDVQRRKPDPEGLLKVVTQLGLQPSKEIAYVGDQETDLEAARRAGLLPVQATWCLASSKSGNELVLERPEELTCLEPAVMISDAARRLLTLLQLPGVGRTSVLNTLKASSLNFGGQPEEPRINRALQQSGAWEKAQHAAEEIIAACKVQGIQMLSPVDQAYPAILRGMGKDQPALLYVQGHLSALPGLAVIGTREPTKHGLEIGRRITTYFADRYSIISGLALGIDSMAHQATLDAGGHTVAVLGHGHGQVHPKQNARLAENILSAGGALISEYPPQTPVRPPYFVERDRIQAGLAQATILIQTDIEGGSWHAARKSLAYGRILAYPVPTQRDIQNNEEKIQGLLLLENGMPEAKADQLNCKLEALERVFRIGSKEDYPILEGVSKTF